MSQSNPIVARTPLRAYPGWTVRRYQDGMFDCTNGVGLSPGCQTFREAVAFARNGGTVPAPVSTPSPAGRMTRYQNDWAA
jgi:hypothetical protein